MPANARTATGTTTATAIVAVDVLFNAGAAEVVVARFPLGVLPVVPPALATMDEEVLLNMLPANVLEDRAAKSELSYTILTPYAFKPPPALKVTILVEVIPYPDERVIGNEIDDAGVKL